MAEHEPQDSTEVERVQLGVNTAVQMIEGCDFVGVTLVDGTTGAVTHVASDPVAEQAERQQHEEEDGPAPDCIRARQAAVVQDVRTETRWPGWTPRAGELGIGSSASLWLHTDDDSLGSLTLYSTKPFRFTPDVLATAQTLAHRLSVGIVAGRRTDQLNAVGSRTVLGQAQGILMERHRIDAEEALRRLDRAAEESGLEPAQVAVKLVRTRELPGPEQHV